MVSAQHELELLDGGGSTHYPLHSIPDVESRFQQELNDLFDAALSFADFCIFLTSTRASDQAAHLVELARALYDETSADLSRSKPRG